MTTLNIKTIIFYIETIKLKGIFKYKRVHSIFIIKLGFLGEPLDQAVNLKPQLYDSARVHREYLGELTTKSSYEPGSGA